MSRLKLEEPERDNLPHPGSTWDMPYSGTYLPHSSPMPFNYTNDTTCYSLTRDGSGSGMNRVFDFSFSANRNLARHLEVS